MGGNFLIFPGSQKQQKSFTTVLASALLEWILIIMLFVYGFFGYLITKFAHICELPIPCLLCSRIDHILGSEKDGYYLEMMCGKHKLEISSLVYCHFHEKLVDVRGMCESCLFSFATKDKSNAETYRLLVGKLGEEDLSCFDDDLIPNENNTKSLNLKNCSCCNELRTSRSQGRKLLQTKSTAFDDSDLDLPLTRELSQDLIGMKKEVKSFHFSVNFGRKTEDSRIQYGYTELKVTSDSESEIPMSDNEDMKTLISNDPLRDLLLDSTLMEPFNSVYEDKSVCDKPIDRDILLSEPLENLHKVKSDIIDSVDCSSVPPSSSTIGHGLEELNWPEVSEVDLTTSMNSTEFRNVSESHIDGNIFVDKSDKSIKEVEISPENIDVKSTRDLDVNETEVVQTSVHETNKPQELESIPISTDLNDLKPKSENKDGGLQTTNQLELVDAYKLAVSSRGRQLTGKESPRLTSDLKLLLSQISRGSEIPLSDILSPSPRPPMNLDELKSCDSSTSIGIKLLQKRLSLNRDDSKSSLDRNESDFGSLDFSNVSEIEGESEVDHLKRQLEHARKFLISLLKELEEERNASAISANETMAMITRLQEEKAALQMEASHDLRMMEEQAEYDMEALDKLNDLLTEKEKEIQDLEAELEYYRTKYPNESGFNDVSPSEGGKIKGASNDSNVSVDDLKSNSQEPFVELETERKQISKCLNTLEKKLRAFCSNRDDVDQSEEQRKDSYDTKLTEDGQNSAMSEKIDSYKKIKSVEGDLVLKEADIIDLLNEVSNLSERLQALESDQTLIERSIDTLKNGEEGLIHEIASHLLELRKIGIRRYGRCNSPERFMAEI